MYTIKQASTCCGLPESTLRYYEQVGIIGPIARDEQSHHRVYQDNDIQKLITVSCLSATGMPLADIRQYMRDAPQGEEAAIRQLELLKAQESRLEEQMKELKNSATLRGLQAAVLDRSARGKPRASTSAGHPI